MASTVYETENCFTGTHLYTWAERGTVRVKCLAQEHNAMSLQELEPGPLDPKASALTMRPPRLKRFLIKDTLKYLGYFSSSSYITCKHVDVEPYLFNGAYIYQLQCLRRRSLYAGGIWKWCFLSKNASNIFRPRYAGAILKRNNHYSDLCLKKPFHHTVIVTSLFRKALFSTCYPHENENPTFSNSSSKSSVSVTD